MTEILQVENLGITFGGLKAVQDVNLTIHKGEIVGLIGPNGAGKTTVFNMLTNVYQPTNGTIKLEDISVVGKKTYETTAQGIARTFQNIRLFRDVSVIDNVKIAMDASIHCNMVESILRLPRYWKAEKEVDARAHELLRVMGLDELAQSKARNLPYGQQRKLEIARALATEPKLLLLDEPAAGMNPQETDELTAFIGEIRDKFKLTVFLIEHHMDLVMDISDRIYVLDFGKLIADGTPEEIQNNQRVIDAYLGVAEDA